MIHLLSSKPELTAHRRLLLLTLSALLISLLATYSTFQTPDPIYAKTFRDLPSQQTNNTRPIARIVVFGDAGRETDDKNRSKLCGGNLWIDHLAESLKATLVSYAHGYTVKKKSFPDRQFLFTRVERVKMPLGNGRPMPLDQQIKSVFAQNPSDSSQVLYVLLVDPTSKTTTIEMLSKAANEILLTKQISRLLILDTPLPFSKEPAGFDSLQLSNYLVNDPRIELMTYDSNGFLRYMQENYYKYGLRHPENPCVYTQRIKCSRPERFFWCQAGKIGDKAHYFMADDIIQKHFLSSVP